jgi:hypothetical protein
LLLLVIPHLLSWAHDDISPYFVHYNML